MKDVPPDRSLHSLPPWLSFAKRNLGFRKHYLSLLSRIPPVDQPGPVAAVALALGKSL
jgi:hypothetical protein